MPSPVKWLSDAAYNVAPLGERMVAWADSQVGVEEHPRGSNRGPMVEQYLEAAGVAPGNPWCSSFLKWAARKAGASDELLSDITAMASSWYWFGQKEGRKFSEPNRGMVFVLVHKNGSGHCGMCISGATLGIFKSIEGNSNDDGSREGYRVVKRFRTVRSVLNNPKGGFINLRGL